MAAILSRGWWVSSMKTTCRLLKKSYENGIRLLFIYFLLDEWITLHDQLPETT